MMQGNEIILPSPRGLFVPKAPAIIRAMTIPAGMFKGSGVAAFDPLSIFSGGTYHGVYFKAAALSNSRIAKDGSGGAPSADGDRVGYATCLNSGKIIKATTDNQRPTLKVSGSLYSWLFDNALTQCLISSAAWDFSAANAQSTMIIAMIDTLGGSSNKTLIANSADFTSLDSSMDFGVGQSNNGDMLVSMRGTTNWIGRWPTTGGSIPYTSVRVISLDMGASTVANAVPTMYENASLMTMNSFGPSGFQAATGYRNDSWGVGAQNDGGIPFKGNLYAFLWVDKWLDSTERGNMTTYFGALAGLTL